MSDYHETLHWHSAWPCDNPKCLEATHNLSTGEPK